MALVSLPYCVLENALKIFPLLISRLVLRCFFFFCRQRRAFPFLSTHPSKGPPVVHRARSYLDVPHIKSLSNVDTHQDKVYIISIYQCLLFCLFNPNQKGKIIKSEVDTKV